MKMAIGGRDRRGRHGHPGIPVRVLVVAVVAVVTVGMPATARPWSGAVDQATWASTGPGIGAASAVPVRWDWPVVGPIVAAWDPPDTPYGSGLRGVDVSVPAGSPVVAMADGVVGWAGHVAGLAWISVDHPGGIRTTVGPVATILVSAGQPVRRGDLLGTTMGVAHPGGSAIPGTVHVSARRDGAYVDPASLVVPLVPTLLPGPEASVG